jgi:putative endonuclease
MNYFVNLLASGRNGTLYVGVTSDLVKRVFQHKNDLADGFTKKYAVHNLVWFESTPSIEEAIRKEKQIKDWKRALEDRVDRERQSAVAGFVRGYSLTPCLDCGSSPQ